MKSTKKQIIIVFAILTMALVLSCAFVACNKTDTPDAPKKEFTITFDTQGGSEVKPITIAEGSTITLPNNPTKEGYVFAGWYLSNALVEEFNITKTITGDITLYAKWIEDSGIRRPSEGLEYSLNSDGNGYKVTGIGTCTDKELIIPSEYNEKPVTSIGNSAFEDCTGLTSVTIPYSVTSIGGSAFSGCAGLTSVTIGDSVTSIGSLAFYGCKGLTSVTIGKGVTSIGDDAFSHCERLTSITVAEGNTKYNSAGNCLIETESKTLITGCENSIIPTDGSVTSIGEGAFYSWGLTSITIPDSVTSIGEGAFSGCTGLTSITIPDSVTSIGEYAFFNTAWYNNQPNGLVYAGKVAYKYKGTMPSNTSIVLKEGTLGIADSAFYGCTGLTSVTIPDSVTSIGSSAFSGCTSLTSITVAKGNTKYHSAGNCLIETESKTLIAGCKNSIIPTDGSVTRIGSYAFERCGLTSVTIPDSVTSIGGRAFSWCVGLTSVTIGKGVTSIGDGAFSNCNGLTSITIPNSVTSIGGRAFSWCGWLTSVTIGDSVTSIGSYAFENCSSLTSVTIPDSVTSIGDYAFRYCARLTSVTIPDSVTSIGSSAFSGCTSLTSITVAKGNTKYHSAGNCLIETESKTLIAGCKNSIIPTDGSVTRIGSYAFERCDLTSVTIPDSVTSIGDSAFSNCTGLTSVTIGDSVTSIGDSAFSDCTGLTSVTIPDSVTSIGESAFV